MQKHIAQLMSFVLLLGMVIGCNKHPSDEQIQKDIQEKAAADPDTKDADVTVAAKDGNVTLSGTVPNSAAQQKLEQIARAEPGAAGVDDQTTVQPNATRASRARGSKAGETASKPQPQPIVVPAGTALTIRLGQALSSKTSQSGQTFLATVAQPVNVAGATAIPAGATATGTVVSAKAKGKIKGQGELSLALTSLTVGGQNYTIQTNTLNNTVKGKGTRTAATTGGGAAGGALIGGLAGGGKGAGIGALVGAGAGLVGGAMTGNQQIEIPAESALTFQLSAPLTLPPGK